MPTMVTLKERIDGFAGRVSATRVKLTVALPLPPPQLTLQTVPFGGPLQEVPKKSARKSTGSKVLLRFMWHPTPD